MTEFDSLFPNAIMPLCFITYPIKINNPILTRQIIDMGQRTKLAGAVAGAGAVAVAGAGAVAVAVAVAGAVAGAGAVAVAVAVAVAGAYYICHTLTPAMLSLAFWVQGIISIASIKSTLFTSQGNLQFSGLEVPSIASWDNEAAPSQYHNLRALSKITSLPFLDFKYPANTPAANSPDLIWLGQRTTSLK